MIDANSVKLQRKTRPQVYEPYFSYAEIADELGITRAAVQQIEQRALRKVARALVLLGYLKEDFL